MARSRHGAKSSRTSKKSTGPGRIYTMVRMLDEVAARIRDRRTQRSRDLEAFLRRCPDSIHSHGYPPGYKGPSEQDVRGVFVEYR